MKKTLTGLIAASLILSGCGWRDSRINPSNWFGPAETVQGSPQTAEAVNPLIPQKKSSGLLSRPEASDTSVLIASVTKLQIDQNPSGAIILAEGIASRQGAYGAELRAANPELVSEDGVLLLEFRVLYPVRNTNVGSELSRKVVDAYTVSRQQLEGVRLVRVTGAQNALESRRR